MVLNALDWTIIVVFFAILLSIGFIASRNAGRSAADFFLSGRNMPWWLLGVSMVATTFSCDTPNLVTDLVRQNGVAGNWAWWAFLLTGMLTVFVYAKLWRRSQVLTDLEFYEIRYSGRLAAFLRGFRAIYLGAFFNIMVIATVSLALIKIGAVMLHWSAGQTLIVASVVVLIYSTIGGLRSILLTDFFQFGIAMTGAIGAAIILIARPEIGGLSGLITNDTVIPKLNLLPDFNNTEMIITLLILPLAVQWWSVWYPGAEPGGGGYVAQRMLSAKNERGAMGATLLFNTLHYALRPWPWILVALASLIVFPDIASLQSAFPNIDPHIVKNDFAYPAMLSLLPNGFLGLVVASLIAAFMSTTASQLNWGSSYIANDFYRRFLNPKATEKQVVAAGRISTVVLMIFAGLFALVLQNALQAFNILLQIGAGTGLIYILRWFWWRINAYTEITGMIVSFLVALYFQFIHPITGLAPIASHWQLVIGVGVTTAAWLTVTLLTKPVETERLRSFYRLVHPGGPGWKKVIAEADAEGVSLVADDKRGWDVPTGILCILLGAFSIYFTLFATGYYIYGKFVPAIALTLGAACTIFLLTRAWRKLKMD
ncbi:MAG: Na+:solute symporter [Bacteroidales bacterium]|jgi:Na+/proline symporter|nr:Na+:solute symporter [Bacteroidales bacterium]MDD2571622.1 Na+:solute symporter [Bacteroidales bacterium]MDD2813440.1 Na+:solute symporter [Bacteroidales bacterium]MDD3385746.1 Na+:solute symporter [Bacteroidales bacterium]MDD3812140.1 Na+:solute symporter [Bacteroidales bacterium]